MVLPTMTSAVATAAAACVVAAALAGCGLPSASAAGAPGQLRVMVKLANPSSDAQAIVAEATRVAGVPVEYAAATTASWHALVLRCADANRCDAALARLRAAGAIYQAVEIDGRKTPAS